MDPAQLKNALQSVSLKQSTRGRRHGSRPSGHSTSNGVNGEMPVTNGSHFTGSDGREVSVASSNGYSTNHPSTVVVNDTCNEDKKKKKSNIPSFVGLANQGSTCYLNSLLQVLFMNKEFRSALYQWNYDPERHGPEERCFPRQLQRLFAFMELSERPTVTTANLTKSFGWDSRNDVFTQHDVEEAFIVILQSLQTVGPNAEVSRFISRELTGHIQHYVQCLDCEKSSNRMEPFHTLVLPVASANSLDQALEEYATEEELRGDNAYECSVCADKKPAVKGSRIYIENSGSECKNGRQECQFPGYICIVLNRFQFDLATLTRQKLYHPVQLPDSLNVNANTGEVQHTGSKRRDETILFHISSIIVHKGGSMGGHYTAYIRQLQKDLWLWFNDARIEVVDTMNVYQNVLNDQSSTGGTGGETPYIIFYRKDSVPEELNNRETGLIPDSLRSEVLVDNKAFQRELHELNRQKCNIRVGLITVDLVSGEWRESNIVIKLRDPLWLVYVRAAKELCGSSFDFSNFDVTTSLEVLRNACLRVWDPHTRKPLHLIDFESCRRDFILPSEDDKDLCSETYSLIKSTNDVISGDSVLSPKAKSILASSCGYWAEELHNRTFFFEYFNKTYGIWSSQAISKKSIYVVPVEVNHLQEPRYEEGKSISFEVDMSLRCLKTKVADTFRLSHNSTRLVWKGQINMASIINANSQQRRFLEENPVIAAAIGEAPPKLNAEKMDHLRISVSSEGVTLSGKACCTKRTWISLPNEMLLRDLVDVSTDGAVFAEQLPQPTVSEESEDQEWLQSTFDSPVMSHLDRMVNEVDVSIRIEKPKLRRLGVLERVVSSQLFSVVDEPGSEQVEFETRMDRRSELDALHKDFMAMLHQGFEKKQEVRLDLRKCQAALPVSQENRESKQAIKLSKTLYELGMNSGGKLDGHLILSLDEHRPRRVNIYHLIRNGLSSRDTALKLFQVVSASPDQFWDQIAEPIDQLMESSNAVPCLTELTTCHANPAEELEFSPTLLNKHINPSGDISNLLRDRDNISLLVTAATTNTSISSYDATGITVGSSALKGASDLLFGGMVCLHIFQLTNGKCDDFALEYVQDLAIQKSSSILSLKRAIGYHLEVNSEPAEVANISIAKLRKFQLRNPSELVAHGSPLLATLPTESTVAEKPLMLRNGDLVVYADVQMTAIQEKLVDQNVGDNGPTQEAGFRISTGAFEVSDQRS